jgi:hypothetical protein
MGRRPPVKDHTTQADRIIARFGNAYRLQEALRRAGYHRSVAAIYKWTYPTERDGTDGMVPTRALQQIIRVARLEGVYLSDDDLRPGKQPL